MNSSTCRPRGFTLVELLVAIALMVIIVTMMATIMRSAQEIYDRSATRARVYANARTALDIIRDDFSHIIPNTLGSDPYELLLRSHPMKLPQSQEWDEYAQPTPPTKAVTSTSDYEPKMLMRFFATVRYYDGTPGVEKQVLRVARVAYFMRYRPPDGGINRPGAFLIRRIEPFHFDPVKGLVWETTQFVEESVCDYVRGVRLWYLERTATPDPLKAGTDDRRYFECISGAGNPSEAPTPPWDSSAAANEGACVWKFQKNWQTDPKPFETQHFLPPAILIEILVTDDRGTAHRAFRQIINITIAPTAVPLKP